MGGERAFVVKVNYGQRAFVPLKELCSGQSREKRVVRCIQR